jgi:nicotinamidase-related amidase
MKQAFLEKSTQVLSEIYDVIDQKPSLVIEDLEADKSALIIVDMINGFAKAGALSSSRVDALIPNIVELSKKCDELGIKKIAFADNHTEDSPEFASFPSHCLCGTEESEVVEEIKAVGNYRLIEKNSTNGFIEPAFQVWLQEHPEINHFLIVGDCTDICVLQLALTLKTHFNRINQKSRIIVPVKSVDTYDLGTHNGDLQQMMALYQMTVSDVEVVKEILIK